MADPSLYELMLQASPDIEGNALQDALRKRAAVGSLVQALGGRQFGGVGAGMMASADRGIQQQYEQQANRLRMALQQQQQAKQDAQFQQRMGMDQARLAEDTRHNRESERNSAIMHSLSGRGTGSAQGGDDVEAIADAIATGKQPPELKGLYRYGAPVRAALARRGIDMTTLQRDWGAVTRHMATLNGQQQERLRQAINFTEHQAGNIETLYNEWLRVAPSSGFRVFNRAALETAKQTGGEAGSIAQALEAQIADLTSEMGNVYMGGNSPTDHSLKLAAENLSANWDEPTFKRAVGLIRQNLQLRRNAMLNSPVAGISENSPYAPKPKAPEATGATEPAPSPSPQRAQGKDGRWYVNAGDGWSLDPNQGAK